VPQAVEALLAILDLEPLERNLFRGRSPADSMRRVFGGQVIGQALVAASRTVEADRGVHSLHAYFMRPGDPAVPIIYDVDRIRDGKSFTTRRVVAIQHGTAIFSMSASFQVEEPGLDHQASAPEVPDPESLPGEIELMQRFIKDIPEPARKYWQRERPIELRPVSLDYYLSPREPHEPAHQVWFRARSALPDDPALHQAVLAYASDMMLIGTALYPHGRSIFDAGMQVASLDHAIWFHRPFRADEWLLYAQDSPSASGARGFARGAIFTRDGSLAASVAQEGLIRVRDLV
jgi:acyl-CoA thioesterase-2